MKASVSSSSPAPTAVTNEAVAANTASVICRSLTAYLKSETELAKQIQTLLDAYNGDIERAGALIGRSWRAHITETGEKAAPISFLIKAAKLAGLTAKSTRLLAGATELVSRQAISAATMDAYRIDKDAPKGPEKSPFEKLMASLKRCESFTLEEGEILSATIAAKVK